MANTFNPLTEQIWRVSLVGMDNAHHRWIAGETWHHNLPVSSGGPVSIPSGLYMRWQRPFGFGALVPQYFPYLVYADRIAPFPPKRIGSIRLTGPAGPQLNAAAPEAAFRLQRVGAGSGAVPLGRICLPITNDNFYTDLPHRRHINTAPLQTLLNTNFAFWGYTNGPVGVRWTACIYHRKSLTWTPVTSYRLLANPVRIWQRWRSYPQPPHTFGNDAIWYPPTYGT